jgi:Gamma tubulin complex component N-terminal
MFMATLDSYVSIMAEWVNRGELRDECQEFFIKPNRKVFDGQDEKVSSKNQWRESFIYRTINLKDLMVSEGMFVPSSDNQ